MLLLAVACGWPLGAKAGDLMQWSDTSVSLLHGGSFEVDPARQTTLTIEQASGWAWGDVYWFVDDIHYETPDINGRRNVWYGEFSPRLSLDKLRGHASDHGLMKEVFIAATYERGRDREATESGLVGLGMDLRVPGFSYAQANVYARKDLHQGDWDTWQLTVSGARPFAVGNQRFQVDGFLDYVAPGGPHGSNLHLVPQIKWDMGHALGHPDGKVWLGAEFDLWRHKYGLDDSNTFRTNQSAVSLLLRWHL